MSEFIIYLYPQYLEDDCTFSLIGSYLFQRVFEINCCSYCVMIDRTQEMKCYHLCSFLLEVTIEHEIFFQLICFDLLKIMLGSKALSLIKSHIQRSFLFDREATRSICDMLSIDPYVQEDEIACLDLMFGEQGWYLIISRMQKGNAIPILFQFFCCVFEHLFVSVYTPQVCKMSLFFTCFQHCICMSPMS